MSAFANASAFFHACESLQGWEGCSPFVAEDAVFRAQCEPLAQIDRVAAYCDWVAELGRGPLAGCSYELHSAAWDEDTATALFFATFHGKHGSEGGPTPPTGRSTASHYVYILQMDETDKVCAMTKVWNAPWAMRELGWD